MRHHQSFLACLFLLVAIASPVAIHSQFQAPTDDELKMTSDPKAPGADAVYLYREETTDFPQQLRSYYSRIKVLTEKGKELATVQIPFERGYTKVEKVEARTIHSDGTVIPLAVKPEDLVDFKSKYYQKDTLVFTLPSVEVGSIVEYRLQIKFSHGVPAPRWLLQCPYFVRKEHFDFQPGSLEGTYVNEYGRILDRLMAAPMPFNAPSRYKPSATISRSTSSMSRRFPMKTGCRLSTRSGGVSSSTSPTPGTHGISGIAKARSGTSATKTFFTYQTQSRKRLRDSSTPRTLTSRKLAKSTPQ